MKQRRPRCMPDDPCTGAGFPMHPEGCGCPDCRSRRKPCDERFCGCDRCTDHAHQPSCAYHRVLMPKVLGAGRCCLRCACVTLYVSGIPSCTRLPLMLTAVRAAGETPAWTLEETDRRRRCLHVVVPLECEVRDACGASMTVQSSIETDVPLVASIPAGDCWRTGVIIQPCVRLICPTSSSDCACFDAQLDVVIEAWLVRWEPFACTAGDGAR